MPIFCSKLVFGQEGLLGASCKLQSHEEARTARSFPESFAMFGVTPGCLCFSFLGIC